MAWNQSSGSAAPVKAPKKPSALRGLVAGLVVVALAGVALFFVLSDKSAAPEKAKEKEKGKIAEVTPAPAPKAEATRTRKAHGKDWREQQVKKVLEKYGTNMPPNLKSYVYHLKNPPQKTFKPTTPYSFLRHPSERDMVSLLSAEPGTFFLVKPEYGESFNNDFMNALVDKVEINDDDSDEVKQIKSFVNATKKEMAELVKLEGKKPSELMNEHATMMYELGRYQENLARELEAARRNPEMSDADVADLFRAANELRKRKGLPEMAVPNLTRRSLQLQKQQQRAARKAAQKSQTSDLEETK